MSKRHPDFSRSLITDGCHKRPDRKARILAKSASTSKPEFEFSRLDFPELQSPKNSNVPETQKPPRWGPLGSAASNISLLGEVGKPVADMVKVSRRAVLCFRCLHTPLCCITLNLPWTVKTSHVAREKILGRGLGFHSASLMIAQWYHLVLLSSKGPSDVLLSNLAAQR